MLGLSDVIVVYYMIRCECWECLSDEQVRYKCWAKTYLVARPTTSMKKGSLCRTSHDKISTHMMMTRDDPDRVMMTQEIQIE